MKYNSGFDAPDPEQNPNFNCPKGYFFEGNHERQNGPARCTLMTCQNHSDLCTDDNANTQQIPNTQQQCNPRIQSCMPVDCDPGIQSYASRIDVQEGQRVDPDTVLGMTGKTGAAAIHLHVQAKDRQGHSFDPRLW